MELGLSKRQIRRIMLDKLRVVYDEWGLDRPPVEAVTTPGDDSRDDRRGLLGAVTAALVDGCVDAVDRNNATLRRALRRPLTDRSGVGSIRRVNGYRVVGTSGPLGHVVDTYFDDHSWTIRYLMIATSELPARNVLLSPHSVRLIDRLASVVLVALALDQLRGSPHVTDSSDIGRTAEIGVLKYYGFPYYWTGRHRWGNASYPEPLEIAAGEPAQAEPEAADEQMGAHHRLHVGSVTDVRLRSVRDLRHYTIHATDGEFGHVGDLLVERSSWAIRYIVVETRRRWPGGRVLLAPQWVSYVSWLDRSVHVDLDQETIRTAPPYDPTRPLDRTYEKRLHAHYGRPSYWRRHRTA